MEQLIKLMFHQHIVNNQRGDNILEINKIHNMNCIEGIKQLKDNSVDLINIDPPYIGVVKKEWDKEENNPMTLSFVNEMHRVLKPTGSLYCWCGIGEKSQSLINFFNIFKDSDFHFKDLITWKKQRGIGMRKGWLYTREEMLWYVKDNKQFVWNKEFQYSDEKRPWNVYKKCGEMVNKSEFKRITNVWTDIFEVGYGSSPKKFKKKRDKINHVTPKPIAAIERTILLHTNPGDLVADFFMGSGTSAVACINTNRNYIGFENDTTYYDIANERIQDAVRNMQ